MNADGSPDAPLGLCVVDKPSGWTSHDVVGRCRRIFGTRKIGHSGTLDPMATGVLVLGVGRATRLLTFLGGEPTADGADNRDKAAELFADAGVTVLPAAEEAQDVNAFVITRELSERLGITKVSDLADHAADLKLGGPPECPERQFCLVGLKDVYGVEFGEFVPLDFGPRVTALKEGGIDVAL